MINCLKNGFTYNGCYYLYDKISMIDKIIKENKHQQYDYYWNNEKGEHCEIYCGFKLYIGSICIFIDKKEEINISINKAEIKFEWYNNILKSIYMLFNKKYRKHILNEYQQKIQKYDEDKKAIQKFKDNSDEKLNNYYNEILKIRNELLKILESKKIKIELKNEK